MSLREPRLSAISGVHQPVWVDAKTERCRACGAVRKMRGHKSLWELNGVRMPRCKEDR